MPQRGSTFCIGLLVPVCLSLSDTEHDAEVGVELR